MLVASTFQLRRPRMLHLLETLQHAASVAQTVYLPPDSPLAVVAKTLETDLPSEQVAAAVNEMSRSPAGVVLFWGAKYRYLVKPPFPVAERADYPDYRVEPLRTLLLRERTIALVLVRLGAYAVGVFHGEKLLSSKVGTGNIHQRHHQGGSSAHRFERHRDKQIEAFFTRICGHAREHLEPHLKQLDYLVYGGTRDTVLELRKQCEFLGRLGNITMESLLNIREPRQATLEAAIGDVYSCKVIEWREISA